MRKHDVRKWLHAILDLLPLFVIPIFAIYSRNENAQFGYEVTQEVNKAVNFNQLNKREYSSLSLNSNNGISRTFNYNTGIYTATWENAQYTWSDGLMYINRNIMSANNQNIDRTHKYFVYFWVLENTPNLTLGIFDTTTPYAVITPNQTYASVITYFSFIVENGTSINVDFDFNLTDLTIMFGEGNEPTAEQFIQWFPLQRYEYTESQEVVIENYETITYNDTDIGSQMVYTLYNTVDKYFNMNNVFNMGAIWNWVNNTMFGGSAPLSAYIVYQIIAYELIMDIIFLLYSVMMFIVDFAEKGIDRFMGRAKR